MSEITVIVPVYNVEPYLRRCVDSILAQTYPDFDVVLVDDGSPDNCPHICDEYAQRDSRVCVIHQENSGPSVARNRGIDWAFEKSTGKYLTFVDSDDYVHPQYLEKLYYALISSSSEISMCRHKYISLLEHYEDVPHGTDQIISVSAEDLMVTEWGSFNYAWGKLYTKKLFAEIRYPTDISFGEDNLTIYRVMFECGRIAFLDDILYFYFRNENGITKSSWSPRSLECFEGIRAQLSYYHANGYQRAYHKEMELYIQQCAYQIHRIREDKERLGQNKPYLLSLRRKMRQLLQENQSLRLRDNLYLYEAMYPRRANVWSFFIRIKRYVARSRLVKKFKKAEQNQGEKNEGAN